MSINNVTVTGNLTRDVQVRDSGGRPYAFGTLAYNPYSPDKDKELDPVFIEFVVNGKQAENFAASARKGSRVILVGSLASRKIDTIYTKDGEERKGSAEALQLRVREAAVSTLFEAVGKGSAGAGHTGREDDEDF